MRLQTIALAIALAVVACARKPAPANPQVKSNTTGATDGSGATGAQTATPDTGSGSAAPGGGEDESHSRGAVLKGGGKAGDPCEGGQ